MLQAQLLAHRNALDCLSFWRRGTCTRFAGGANPIVGEGIEFETKHLLGSLAFFLRRSKEGRQTTILRV